MFSKDLTPNIRIELFQNIETRIEAKLDSRALGNIGKISLTLRIVSHTDSR